MSFEVWWQLNSFAVKPYQSVLSMTVQVSGKVGNLTPTLSETPEPIVRISITVEARNFKFGTHIDHEGC